MTKEEMKRKGFLVLWGGTDINPELYKNFRHSMTEKSDDKRDKAEIALYEEARKLDLPVFGVCRGAQLVSALNGHQLYQHSIGHNRSHDLMYYSSEEKINKIIPNVAADHHQIIKLDGFNGNTFDILAWATHETRVWLNDQESNIIDYVPEVIWFESTNTLAIQPHPEWMPQSHPFNVWLQGLITELTGVTTWPF